MCSETYFKGKNKKECDNLPIIFLVEKSSYVNKKITQEKYVMFYVWYRK